MLQHAIVFINFHCVNGNCWYILSQTAYLFVPCTFRVHQAQAVFRVLSELLVQLWVTLPLTILEILYTLSSLLLMVVVLRNKMWNEKSPANDQLHTNIYSKYNFTFSKRFPTLIWQTLNFFKLLVFNASDALNCMRSPNVNWPVVTWLPLIRVRTMK